MSQMKSLMHLTSAAPVAEIRKPPNVSQTHSTANASQRELYLLAPCRSVGPFLHVCCLSTAKCCEEVGWVT